jgi:hypothetical protein
MYYSSGTLKKYTGNTSSRQIWHVGSEEPWSKLYGNFGNFFGQIDSIKFSIRLISFELYTIGLFQLSKTLPS